MNDIVVQNTELVSEIGATTPTSWTPPADMDFDTFQRIGNTFQQIKYSLSYWLGDWLVAGEERFGDAAYQAVPESGKSHETLLKFRAVAFRIPKEIRQSSLTWTHSFYCAYIPEEQRGPLLEIAANVGLSSRELKDVVKLDDDTRYEFILAAQNYVDEEGGMTRETFMKLLNRFKLGDTDKPKEEADDDEDGEAEDEDSDSGDDEDHSEEVAQDDLLDFWENAGVPVTACGTYGVFWEGISVRAALDGKNKPYLIWEKSA